MLANFRVCDVLSFLMLLGRKQGRSMQLVFPLYNLYVNHKSLFNNNIWQELLNAGAWMMIGRA